MCSDDLCIAGSQYDRDVRVIPVDFTQGQSVYDDIQAEISDLDIGILGTNILIKACIHCTQRLPLIFCFWNKSPNCFVLEFQKLLQCMQVFIMICQLL